MLLVLLRSSALVGTAHGGGDRTNRRGPRRRRQQRKDQPPKTCLFQQRRQKGSRPSPSDTTAAVEFGLDKKGHAHLHLTLRRRWSLGLSDQTICHLFNSVFSHNSIFCHGLSTKQTRRSCRGPTVSARPLPRRAILSFRSALLPPFLFLFFFLFPKSSPFALSFLFRNGTERRRSRVPNFAMDLAIGVLLPLALCTLIRSSPTFSLAISIASMPPRTHRALPPPSTVAAAPVSLATRTRGAWG